jgi:hypothetical protein
MKHILCSEYMYFTYMTDNKKRFNVFFFLCVTAFLLKSVIFRWGFIIYKRQKNKMSSLICLSLIASMKTTLNKVQVLFMFVTE